MMKTNRSIINSQRLFTLFTVLWLLNPLSDLPVSAQSQKTWQWVKQLGSASWDISSGVVCDSKNNIFVTGSYFDTLNCFPKTLKSSGNQDLFIAMFDENGSLKEITSAGGRGNDLATCIIASGIDNLAIGGVIADSAMFGKIVSPGNGKRLFVSGLDSRARFTWVSTIAVSDNASLYMIGADKPGNIFVAGVFSGTLSADKQEVTSKGKKDIFLARFSKSGVFEKLFSFGSEEDDSPSSLSVDGMGNIVLAGVFGKPIETGEVKLFPGTATTKTNLFITMFDRDFNAKWANVLKGDDYANITSLKHDKAGNLYASGSFSSSFHIADTVLISKGYTDAFLLKYKPDGILDWGRSFGSWYYDYAASAIVDNLGGAIITGSIGDTLAIDSLRIEPVSKDNSALIVQFSSKGEATWADCISGNGRNFSNASVLDKQGNLYFTGSFRNKFEKGNDVLTSYGDQDVFLARYYNCPTQKAEIFGDLSFCEGSNTELSVKRSFSNVVWNDTLNGKYSIIANKPGEYWVSMLDKKGCLLTDTIQITQNPLPLFSLGQDTTMLLSDSLILYAPKKYHNYFWSDYSTGPEFLAKAVEGASGTEDFWLTVTDSLSCNFSDTITIKFLKRYNWVDLEKVQLITYPNPAVDHIFWYLKTDEACQLVAELADGNGRVLYHQFFREYLPGEVKELSLANMPSGIYNMRISNSSSGKKYKTVRVIKK